MRIEQLEHFLEVEKCNSISQAAENLFMGQTTLSRSINALENELGNKLFIRTNKGVLLTSFGISVLQYAEEIIQCVTKIQGLSGQTDSLRNATLSIYAHPIGNSTAVYSLIKFIQNSYEGCKIYSRDIQPEETLSELINSGHKLGINSANPLNYEYIKASAETHNFICAPVYNDYLCAFVHKNHPLAKYRSLDVEELLDQPVAIYRSFLDTGSANLFYRQLKSIEQIYAVENYDLLKSLIFTGKTVVIAPSLGICYDVLFRCGEIIKIRLTKQPELITFLIYPKDISQLSDLEKVALDFLQEYYHNLTLQQDILEV